MEQRLFPIIEERSSKYRYDNLKAIIPGVLKKDRGFSPALFDSREIGVEVFGVFLFLPVLNYPCFT
jgi:hypothetical protein